MTIVVYIVLVFTGIQLFTVFINLLYSQQLGGNKLREHALVSVLIPARNEEKSIANILNDLQQQTYKNIEIIVFNDNSSDNTAVIVREKIKYDNRIQLINSTVLPNNWLGKNWACHQLATKAEGAYFLFLDADVRAKNDLISETLAYSQQNDLQLLSIFPKQIMNTWGEKLTVPLMHYILLTLLPLIFVRLSPFSSHSAANGQFMLFNAQTYKKYFPHQLFKSEKVEDIKIAHFYKSKKQLMACITGTDKVCCSMYSSYNEAVNGFSKNVVMFFGNSYLLAILFGAMPFIGIFILSFYSNMLLLFGYIITLLFISVLFSLVATQNVWMNIVLFIPQQIVLLIIIAKSLIYKFTKQQKWKGRLV